MGVPFWDSVGVPFWDPVSTVASGEIFAADDWDIVFIAGFALPGICSVKCQPQVSFKQDKVPGTDGALITVGGYLPGPIEIEVVMWTPEHLAEMVKFRDVFWRLPNKGALAPAKEGKAAKAARLRKEQDAQAKSISHPALDLLGVHNVVIIGISTPEPGSVSGTKVMRIKCIEWVPVEARDHTARVKAAAAQIPIAPELTGGHSAPELPSKTDIHPGGPAVSRVGGAH